MNRFAPILTKINDQLTLPQPAKSRILLEIAGDLNDLYHHYLDQGLDEDTARQKTLEKFALTDAALSELVQIHQSLLRRLMDRLSEQAQTRWERLVLTLVLLVIALVGANVILSEQFFLQASQYTWPILIIFFGIIVIALVKFYQLYLKKDHTIRRLQSGIPIIFILGCTNIFLGVYGYIIELYTIKSTAMYSGLFDVIVTLLPSGANEFFNAVAGLSKLSSMAMVCVFVTLLTALILFMLIIKVKKIEQAEVVFLLEND